MDFITNFMGAFSMSVLQSFRSTISTVGIILILIQLELNLILNFLLFMEISNDIDDIVGELFGLYILVLGACETAIGLSLLVSYYRISTNLNIQL